VPSLAEIVEPIRVNIIDPLVSRHLDLVTNAAMSIGLRLKANTLMRFR
jgi:hypothetical protein